MTQLERITKLTELWMTLIGGDHHKDRDCHWIVEMKFSYGDPPTYSFYHYGYRYLEVYGPKRNTIEEAINDLEGELKKAFKYFFKDAFERKGTIEDCGEEEYIRSLYPKYKEIIMNAS